MIELSLDGSVARLRLDRPASRNAIPVAGWARLSALCAEVGTTGARALVLSGSPEAFSAGADLGEFAALASDPEAVSAFRLAMRRGVEALAALPIATLAQIEGPCFGAAVALVMACDIRVAGPGARFAITPAKLGISYPQEDVARLVSLVGPGQASRLILSAGTVDGVEAASIGLVEIFSEEATAAVDSLVREILSNSAGSVGLLKGAVRASVAGVWSEESTDRAFDERFASADFSRRLEAFRAGR
jgi:enoyl-CoA hydratase/carnithine racemase